MNPNETVSPSRQAATNGLAVIGFIALVIAGVWLAVYATRWVPTVGDKLGTAATYLGSVFTPSKPPALSVVPTPSASTTLSFGDATSSAPTATTTPNPIKPKPTSSGGQTNHTYPSGGGTVVTTPAPYGLADLSVSITQIGYLTSADATSFVGTSIIPSGSRPAVRFTIKNVGTNWSGTWRFTAKVPTFQTFTFSSDVQQSLAPGDSIDYTLGFDEARSGTQEVFITADSDKTVQDSNTNNNTATAQMQIGN